MLARASGLHVGGVPPPTGMSHPQLGLTMRHLTAHLILSSIPFTSAGVTPISPILTSTKVVKSSGADASCPPADGAAENFAGGSGGIDQLLPFLARETATGMAMAAMMRETTSRALRRNEYLCSRTTIQDSFSSSSSVAASPRRGGGSLGESLSRGDVGGRARGLPTTTLRSVLVSSFSSSFRRSGANSSEGTAIIRNSSLFPVEKNSKTDSLRFVVCCLNTIMPCCCSSSCSLIFFSISNLLLW
mmetsp:Transcript_1905/g.4232  ORF Transcript_1905/g.4232 Transcript_1905/m.4232 type:complete len:245 (+) Transcript_1905:1033-1767(+)